MSAIIEKTAKVPKAIVSEVAKAGKEAMKPAQKSDMTQIAVGAVAGGLLTPVYNRLSDFVMSLLPIKNNVALTLAHSLMPFGLSYLIYKLRIPLGNVLAGSFLGVGINNILNWIIGLFTGGLKTAKTVASAPSAESESVILGNIDPFM